MFRLGFNQHNILTSLSSQGIRIYSQQCAKVRHRRSTCTLCADHCPAQAITWQESLQVDPDKCAGCGICAAVCPVGAFEAEAPTNMELLTRIQGHVKEGVSIVFACPKYLRTKDEGGDRFIQVNCLGRIEESVLLSAVAAGAQVVSLVDAPCQECSLSTGRVNSVRAVQRVNELLQTLNIPQRIFISSNLPSNGSSMSRLNVVADEISRRKFFGFLTRRAAKTAVVAIDSILGNQGGEAEEPQTLKKKELPVRVPTKHRLLLQSLQKLCRPIQAQLPVNGLSLGKVKLTTACTGCAMCSYFCPTGALRRCDEQSKVVLTFRVSLCTGCGLCREICFWNAVVLSSEIELSKVFNDVVEVVLRKEIDSTRWLASEEKMKKLLDGEASSL